MIIYIFLAISIGYYKPMFCGIWFCKYLPFQWKFIERIVKEPMDSWKEQLLYKNKKINFFLKIVVIYQTLIVQNLKIIGMNPKSPFKTLRVFPYFW
jgi:hypothetical protein